MAASLVSLAFCAAESLYSCAATIRGTTRFDFAPEMTDCLAESCFFPSVTATPEGYCDSQPLRDELPLLLSISSPKIRTEWKEKFRLGPEEIAMVKLKLIYPIFTNTKPKLQRFTYNPILTWSLLLTESNQNYKDLHIIPF